MALKKPVFPQAFQLAGSGIRFLYGPRFFGGFARASMAGVISSMLHSRSVMSAAMAGDTFRLLWMV